VVQARRLREDVVTAGMASIGCGCARAVVALKRRAVVPAGCNGRPRMGTEGAPGKFKVDETVVHGCVSGPDWLE
jgi:hypothetical protein